MYRWIVFLHLVSVFAFLLAHGIAVGVALKLRGERDRTRITALLDLSSRWLMVVHASVLAIIATGVGLGFMGGFWGRGWIWVSLGVLVALYAAMGFLGTSFYDGIRLAVGAIPVYGSKRTETPEAAEDATLEALLTSGRPILLTVIGIGGLLVILWLMIFKPF